MEPTESLPLETAEEIIRRWASEEAREKMMFEGDRQEFDHYLKAVDEIQRFMLCHDHIIQSAMARLEDEYRNILVFYSNTVYDIFKKDLIPRDAVYDLRCIAVRMISSGYLRDCIQVHATIRKSALDARIRRFQSCWKHSSDVVKNWIGAAQVCVWSLFSTEKKLCKLIFDGLGTGIDDACFMETVKEHALRLFNFPEAITISISPTDPENLVKILQLHGAWKDLMPYIDRVFDSKSCESIRVQAAQILFLLAEAARGIFSEFENALLREPSKPPVPDGKIHPLTKDVMDYLSVISDYKQTLNKLVVSKPSTRSRYFGDPSTPDMDFAEPEGKTPLAIHLIWIIETLQFHLDDESKHYKDASLSNLFMMNNIHYVVDNLVRSLELGEIIGDDYLKKLTDRFQHAAASYHKATWERVLDCLREEGLPASGDFSSKVLRCALRKRFRAFNAKFEEVHRTQAAWLIPNSQLQEELRVSISKKLIPAYKAFLRRFMEHIESGKHPENYIKYSVNDLESAVLNLFKGTLVSQNLRKRFLHWKWRR